MDVLPDAWTSGHDIDAIGGVVEGRESARSATAASERDRVKHM
jgi:hypothetical protein